MLGHNAGTIQVNIEVRLFNSISPYAGEGGIIQKLSVPAGSDIGDVLQRFSIPKSKVFMVFVNGKDISPEMPKLGAVRTTYVLDEGDVVALSGPVPYSWGYGSPIV